MAFSSLTIRNAKPVEFAAIGQLMVDVYSKLDGFPNQNEQPEYYNVLKNVGKFAKKENCKIIVAINKQGKLVGALVYFSDMKNYGSGGTASQLKNASAFRLLAVDSNERGQGIGKLLCLECINRARALNQNQIYIHSTKSMKVAWGMYQRLGFVRYPAIDFNQEGLEVFGFKLDL